MYKITSVIFRNRLKNSTKSALESNFRDDENDPSYKEVINSIILHKKVLKLSIYYVLRYDRISWIIYVHSMICILVEIEKN